MMELGLSRLRNNGETTIGILLVNWDHFCETVEDAPREVKIPGKTRIPAGVYKLGIRKQLTPLTIKYRDIYPWFEYHIEILDVPNFSNVYIHVGNWHTNTDGCILVGKESGWMVTESRKTFQKLYEAVYPHIDEYSTITILDENQNK